MGASITADNVTTINGGAAGTPLVTTSPHAGATATGDSDDALASFPDITYGTSATITVPVSGVPSTGAKLCGWVDANINGTFEPGERVCTTLASGATSASLTFSIPATAGTTSSDITYARLRIVDNSATADFSPNGLLSSGEVEDYRLNLLRSDMSPVLGTLPAAFGPGQTVTGLTLTCTNAGPGIAVSTICAPSASAGTVSNISCTPNPPAAVAAGASISCTFSFTAPGTSGGGDTPATAITFTGTTGADNDSNSGNNTTTSTGRPMIDALHDTLGPIDGGVGGTTASVLGNDTNGAAAATTANVTITNLPGATFPSGGSALSVNTATGAITVPAGATPGTYTVPYQICANPATTPAACDTAVATVIVQGSDFGDAPATYGDASHSIPTTQDLWLATASSPFDVPDSEGGMQYSAGADGDNNNGTNDENAVTISALLGGTIQTSVTVQNNTGASATLCAWLDGAGTGVVNDTFDAGEGQCVTVGTGSTVTDLTWTVPNTLQITTYLRVRVTTGALTTANPTGGASNGEVEDYQLIILPTRALISRFAVERDAATGLPAVVWDTASEQGTLGFYLERWDAGLEQWLRLNADLLPGLIDAPMGGQYRLIDDGVAEGEAHRYRLIEVEAWGGTNTYGPYEVSVGGAGLRSRARVSLGGRAAPAAEAVPDAQSQGEGTWADWRSLAPGFEGRARQPSAQPRGGHRKHGSPSEVHP